MRNIYYSEKEEGMMFFYKDRDCKNFYAKMPTHYENAPKFDQETITLNCVEFNLVDLDRTSTLIKCVIERVRADFIFYATYDYLSLGKIASLAARGYSSNYIYGYGCDSYCGAAECKYR